MKLLNRQHIKEYYKETVAMAKRSSMKKTNKEFYRSSPRPGTLDKLQNGKNSENKRHTEISSTASSSVADFCIALKQ